MKIHGVEGMSAENIREEINRGGRLVIYTYCVSVLILTFKRNAGIRLIKAGHSPVSAGLPYVLLSLVAGWWGFPWGPIYTIETIYRNLGGGVDVTDDVLRTLTPASPDGSAPQPVASPSLTVDPVAPRRGFNWRIAGGMAGTAAALIALGVTFYCYQQQQDLTLVLVSGVDTPYTVSLNGRPHRLAPHSAGELHVPEGEFTLADAAGGHVVGPPRTYRFTRPLFSHLDTAHIAVLNPDRAALLAQSDVPYYRTGATPPANEQPAFAILANHDSYFLPKPNYAFTPAEQNISMPADATRVVRTRLEVLPVQNLAALVPFLIQKLGYAPVRDWLMTLARHRADEALLGTAVQHLKPADLTAFFQLRLAERPLLIEWHRYYQQAMELNHPDHDLVAEYRRALEAEPANGALAYLLGRLVRADEAEGLWQRALAAPQPSAYAYNAIGFDAASLGRFAEARQNYEQAARAGISSRATQNALRQTLLALGRYDDLLANLRTARQAAPQDIELASEELCALLAAGRIDAAQQLKRDYLRTLQAQKTEAPALADSEAYLQSFIAYHSGQYVDYATLLTRFPVPYYQFRSACTRQDLGAAAAIVQKNEHPRATEFLLLYLLAHRQGATAQAEDFYQRALATMRTQEHEFRELATLLTAPAIDAGRVCQARIQLEEKRILLAALCLHDPANRRHYQALGTKLNFLPDFPQHWLRTIFAPDTAP